MYYPPTWISHYLTVMNSMWQGDMGINFVEFIFQRHLTQWKRMRMPFEWIGAFQLSTNPSGNILIANLPPFSNICPRYGRWGIPHCYKFIGRNCVHSVQFTPTHTLNYYNYYRKLVLSMIYWIDAISPTPISPTYYHLVPFRLLMQNVTKSMWNSWNKLYKFIK